MSKEFTERLEKAGTQSIDKLFEWANAAENFLTEQTPLVIQEIITWGIASHSFKAAICIFLSLTAVGVLLCNRILWLKVNSYKDITWEDKNELFPSQLFFVLSRIVAAIAFIVSFWIACVQIYSVIYIYIAPRLYILEVLSELMKK